MVGQVGLRACKLVELQLEDDQSLQVLEGPGDLASQLVAVQTQALEEVEKSQCSGDSACKRRGRRGREEEEEWIVQYTLVISLLLPTNQSSSSSSSLSHQRGCSSSS